MSIEGPIHIEPAIQRLMNVCGVFKPGPVKPGPVDYQIGEQIIENCESNGNIERRSDFLWPVVKKQSLPRVYDPEIPESKREIAHIAPEELDAAMLLVIQGSVGIGKESLYHETIKMFGFRVTDNTKTYLERTLERLQNLGRCRVDGNHVSVE